MQANNALNIDSVTEQFKEVFKCPLAIAQGVPTFNIRDEVIAQVKSEQKAERLRVQTLLNHN